MRHRPRTLPLEIVADHPLVRLRGHAAVIDTGSPLTFRAPSIVSEQLGQPVRWLVGTDTLRKHRVLIDWAGRRVVTGGPTIRGDIVELVPMAGLYQILIDGPGGRALAFLDSGAPISYAPAAAVEGLTPIGRRKDWYPLFGEFDVDVYQLRIRVGARTIDASFGVLPELLAALLSVTGSSGWILGSDFFRGRAIQLELACNRLVDAPAESARPNVTRLEGRSTLPHAPAESPRAGTRAAGSSAIRETTAHVEGWRGWRLATTADGTPRLLSLTARYVWDGPVFVSDRTPALRGRDDRAGVHAFRTPGGLASLMSGSSAIVYGQVTLLGQVCVHETGFRAERARIDRLYVRGCGFHPLAPSTAIRGSVSLFGHEESENALSGAYCGCRSLAHDEWLTFDKLERLAAAMEARYQCDVMVDMQRARTADHACTASRLLTSPSARNS